MTFEVAGVTITTLEPSEQISIRVGPYEKNMPISEVRRLGNVLEAVCRIAEVHANNAKAEGSYRDGGRR